jgi:hypothetical protein
MIRRPASNASTSKALSTWIVSLSPYDRLTHAAEVVLYMTSGEPAVRLLCDDDPHCKMPRRRYELHDQAVTCLTCLVRAL